MPIPNDSSSQLPADDSNSFEDSAYKRLSRFMIYIAIAGTPVLWFWLGTYFAMGFIVGCVVAIANFKWLKQIVNHMANNVMKGGRSAAGRLVMRFLLRYFLIALAAYTIFKISLVAVYGLFAGLSVPVAAILFEVVYEARTTFDR